MPPPLSRIVFPNMDDPIDAQQLEELTNIRQVISDRSINLTTLEQNCPLDQSSIRASSTASLQPLGR